MTSMTSSAPAVPRPSLLRTMLKVDGVTTAVGALAYMTLAGPLEDLLGLDATLLRGLGAFLMAYAAFVYVAGSARTIPLAAATLAVAGNAGWAAMSALAALTGWHDPTGAGTAWIVAQALIVAGYSELQLIGLRRERRLRASTATS